jgi:DNA mismatch repair protein MLH1
MLKHAFVGIVDLSLGLSLIQYSTKLYLVNHTSLACVPPSSFNENGLIGREEHFYQLGLRQFGAFNRLRLDPPPLLRDLISLAAEDEPGIQENNLDLNEVVEVSRLVQCQWLM